ncbi:MAG: family cryptochrome [Sphingobacteriaceae bacterium]|nr:family cryptochrome [Sphingobacteriaceae bacterium]
MPGKTILVWFRNDLRIHDNEILLEAVKKADHILPVYCFDPRYFTESPYRTLKTGAFRAKFLIESVAGLRASLENLGGGLLVACAKPEEVLPEIARRYQVSEVYHHREVAVEETDISAKVEAALWKLQINLKHFIGHTLYHKEDLPFPIKDIPDVFSTFRKKIERDSAVRPSFATPVSISTPQLEPTELPTLSDLGLEEPKPDPHSVLNFKGGEAEGLKRMHEYFWQKDMLKSYKANRGVLLGSDSSSKLSPWISLGCLSTREVYWEIKKYEKEWGASDSTHSLILELLWRDYFRFMFKKHGYKYFSPTGSISEKPELSATQAYLFEKWKNGATGIPFIDANMRELKATGFMSNKGRQVVASFLIHNLQVDGAWGAAWFEENLLDHSPASNRGNWAYAAGVANDPREKRQFDVLKQAPELDPKGDYVRTWIPDLAAIPGAVIHKPWALSPEEIAAFGIEPSSVYLHPVLLQNYFPAN